MTIPDHYRQWAAKEAERKYPRKMWPEGTLDEVRRQRMGYEAALLRMWPLVDALQKAIERQGFSNEELIAARKIIATLK